MESLDLFAISDSLMLRGLQAFASREIVINYYVNELDKLSEGLQTGIRARHSTLPTKQNAVEIRGHTSKIGLSIALAPVKPNGYDTKRLST